MSQGEDSSKSSENRGPEQYVATPLSVAKIRDAKFVRQPNLPSFIVTPGGRKVNRINLIAVLVGKPDDRTILLDDGSGLISATFSSQEGLAVGDVVHLRGRSGEVDGYRYLLPDFVRTVDQAWLSLRNLELEHRFQDVGDYSIETVDEHPEESRSMEIPTSASVSAQEENPSIDQGEDESEKPRNPVEELYVLIQRMDTGSGVGVSDLVQRAGKENIKDSEGLLQTLLEQGDVFLPRPGLVKTLE